jgi:hypothetical protein
MDIKGDFSGIAKEGEEKPFITGHMLKNIHIMSQNFLLSY